MKNLLYFSLPVFALLGLASCNPDKDPKIDTNTEFEFKLNTPPLAAQFIDLSTNGQIQFTVSQPNYGVTVVPTYGVEISLSPNFEPIIDQPVVDAEGEEHIVPGFYALNLDSQLKGILVSRMSDIAAGINELNGVYDAETYTEDYVGPLYVRATAYLGSGHAADATAVVSNTITLSQVQGYASFPSDEEITFCVPGGANEWNHIPQIVYVGDENGAMIAKGFTFINGQFKVTDGDWAGSGNWGGSMTANADGTFSGDLIQNSQDNFNGDDMIPTGLYYVVLTLTDASSSTDNATVGTIDLTAITSVNLPGDYNGWDAGGSPLSDDGDYLTWSGNYSVNSNGWKFAFNGSWAINLGGDPENLSFDGDNITLEGSKVTLNLQQYPWSCTVE